MTWSCWPTLMVKVVGVPLRAETIVSELHAASPAPKTSAPMMASGESRGMKLGSDGCRSGGGSKLAGITDSVQLRWIIQNRAVDVNASERLRAFHDPPPAATPVRPHDVV